MKKLMSRWRPMRIILVCLLIVAALPVIYVTARLVVGARHATQNAIQVENSKPGTDGWNDFTSDLQYDLISGYGSKISVNHGDSLDLYVTTTAPSFSIDVFRTGWYGGIGARKVTSLGSFTGVHQPMPNPDPKTGLIDCNWTKTTTLNIPSDWVTGVYLAKLTTSTNKSSFIFFVVRDDGGHEDIVFQTSVTAYQAYNTFVAKNTPHWIYAGTGFTDGSQVPGIIGYEYDRVFNNGATPPSLTVLGSSPVNACCGTGNSHADTTIYTAPSGARVFASGTIQWSLGLDNSQGNTYANEGIQQMTANLLNNIISAAPPGVSLNPGSINFGNQNINIASSSQNLTLINNGSSALTISSIGITGGSASDFSQSNTCPISPSTLAAHSSCTISVTYQPSVQGNSNATLTINDDASGSSHTAALTGAGVVPAPGSRLSPTSLDFGTQNLSIASGAKQITLTDNGTAALTINSIGISGTNASDYTQSNSCPASSSTLAPNASYTINVTFTPAGLGTRSATLTVSDSAAGSPYAIALTGTGINSTIYFSDGFEGGNTSLWSLLNSDSSGSVTVESNVVHAGTKAAAITSGSNQYAYLYAPLSSAQVHTYTRFYIRLASTRMAVL